MFKKINFKQSETAEIILLELIFSEFQEWKPILSVLNMIDLFRFNRSPYSNLCDLKVYFPQNLT